MAMERAPAREPVIESSGPQLTLADGNDQIPTPATSAIPSLDIRRQQIPTLDTRIPALISSGPGAQAGLEDWPPLTSELDPTRPVVHDYCDDDDYDAMYWDENVDPYDTKMLCVALCIMINGDLDRFIHPNCHLSCLMCLIVRGHSVP